MRLLAKNPVHKHVHNYATTNVTTAAWAEIIASLPVAASAVEIYSGNTSVVKLSVGAAADEDANEINYYVIPGGSSILLPLEFTRGKRISAKAVNVNATTGVLVFNFFG